MIRLPCHPSRSRGLREAFLEGKCGGKGGGGIGSEWPLSFDPRTSRTRSDRGAARGGQRGGDSEGGTESPEARPGIREAEAPQQGAVRPRAQGKGAMCGAGQGDGTQASIPSCATRVQGCYHLCSFVQKCAGRAARRTRVGVGVAVVVVVGEAVVAVVGSAFKHQAHHVQQGCRDAVSCAHLCKGVRGGQHEEPRWEQGL